jgi:hypothetical protein
MDLAPPQTMATLTAGTLAGLAAIVSEGALIASGCVSQAESRLDSRRRSGTRRREVCSRMSSGARSLPTSAAEDWIDAELARPA